MLNAALLDNGSYSRGGVHHKCNIIVRNTIGTYVGTYMPIFFLNICFGEVDNSDYTYVLGT